MYDDSGTLLSRFIPGLGLDEHFISIASGDNVYLHTDRIGSVIAETNASGAVLNKFAFSPFGESSSVSSSNFGYTGQRYDSEIGLYNYKMRYYSPIIGRFLQPDPLGYEAGDLNMYTYVGNDALNLTDPLGLEPGLSQNKQPKWSIVPDLMSPVFHPPLDPVILPSDVQDWTAVDAAGNALQILRTSDNSSATKPSTLFKQFGLYVYAGGPVVDFNVAPTVSLGTYTIFPNDPAMANYVPPAPLPLHSYWSLNPDSDSMETAKTRIEINSQSSEDRR